MKDLFNSRPPSTRVCSTVWDPWHQYEIEHVKAKLPYLPSTTSASEKPVVWTTCSAIWDGNHLAEENCGHHALHNHTFVRWDPCPKHTPLYKRQNARVVSVPTTSGRSTPDVQVLFLPFNHQDTTQSKDIITFRQLQTCHPTTGYRPSVLIQKCNFTQVWLYIHVIEFLSRFLIDGKKNGPSFKTMLLKNKYGGYQVKGWNVNH